MCYFTARTCLWHSNREIYQMTYTSMVNSELGILKDMWHMHYALHKTFPPTPTKHMHRCICVSCYADIGAGQALSVWGLGLWAEWSGVRTSTEARNFFSSSPRRPDSPCGPPSLLFMGTGSKEVWACHVLEWVELCLCSPYMPSWHGQDHLYLYPCCVNIIVSP
jgi:hypothetical protein